MAKTNTGCDVILHLPCKKKKIAHKRILNISYSLKPAYLAVIRLKFEVNLGVQELKTKVFKKFMSKLFSFLNFNLSTLLAQQLLYAT